VFVSGGTAGNLSALVVARHRWRLADPARERTRAILVCSEGAHSSIASAARVMDADVVSVPPDGRGRLTGTALAAAVDVLEPGDRDRICAVVATGGTTNVGVVDDLAGAADVADRLGVWLHVDGAYGGAALAAPSRRPRFAGIERADSFIVDPHKWLFAPYDCCALVYRDPFEARRAHTQHAEYLDVLHGAGAHEPWNPSDFAYHLSRRARGLPLWFSVATHGTDAYRDAVERCLALTDAAAELVRAAPHLELVLEPELSVLVFRRIGWTPAEYQSWSDRALAAETAFVVPSSWQGETVLRFCFVNPRTTTADVAAILASMA
jgi:glutamate/tyrosine decarboxylase-like PLP-dependent enzyme